MTASDIFELRRQGHTEEAYEAARALYADNKEPQVTLAMFWAAVDMLRRLIATGRSEKAQEILTALKTILPELKDKNGWAREAYVSCERLLDRVEQLPPQQADGPEHLQMGFRGEELAVAYLREKGYVILERDWRSGHRDIDIIARHGDCTVFVEVKARHSDEINDPVESVDYRKQQNIQRSINHYVKGHHVNPPIRFDVITVVGTIDSQAPKIRHIENFKLTAEP